MPELIEHIERRIEPELLVKFDLPSGLILSQEHNRELRHRIRRSVAQAFRDELRGEGESRVVIESGSLLTDIWHNLPTVLLLLTVLIKVDQSAQIVRRYSKTAKNIWDRTVPRITSSINGVLRRSGLGTQIVAPDSVIVRESLIEQMDSILGLCKEGALSHQAGASRLVRSLAELRFLDKNGTVMPHLLDYFKSTYNGMFPWPELLDQATTDFRLPSLTNDEPDCPGRLPAAVALAKADSLLRQRFDHLRSYIVGLGDDVKCSVLKYYFAFKRASNFACVEVHPSRRKLRLHVSLDPAAVGVIPGFTRDMRNTDHLGTWDLEILIRTWSDLEQAKPLLLNSYQSNVA